MCAESEFRPALKLESLDEASGAGESKFALGVRGRPIPSWYKGHVVARNEDHLFAVVQLRSIQRSSTKPLETTYPYPRMNNPLPTDEILAKRVIGAFRPCHVWSTQSMIVCGGPIGMELLL